MVRTEDQYGQDRSSRSGNSETRPPAPQMLYLTGADKPFQTLCFSVAILAQGSFSHKLLPATRVSGQTLEISACVSYLLGSVGPGTHGTTRFRTTGTVWVLLPWWRGSGGRRNSSGSCNPKRLGSATYPTMLLKR